MASITKIVTALVVLDKHPLAVGEAGPAITMGSADVALRSHYWGAYRAKVFPVWAGLTFTERELLDLALIESAANYAGSLATWAFGSDAGVRRRRSRLARRPRSRGHHDRRADRPRPGERGDRPRRCSNSDGSRSPIRSSREIVGHRGAHGPRRGAAREHQRAARHRQASPASRPAPSTTYGSNLLFSADVPTGDGGQVTIVGVVLGGPGPKHDILDADVPRTAREHPVDLPRRVADGCGGVVRELRDRVGPEFDGGGGDDGERRRVGRHPGRDAGERATRWAPARPAATSARSSSRRATRPSPCRSNSPRTIEDPGPWWRLGHPGLIFGAP